VSRYHIILKWEDGEYQFLTEGSQFDYSEPNRPGRELVGNLSLVALPYECGNCSYPNFAISERILRGDPATSVLTGECKNCFKLIEVEIDFRHTVNTLDVSRLELLQIGSGGVYNFTPLLVGDTQRTKRTLEAYP